MSDLIVIGYPDEETAMKAWQEVTKLERDYLIDLEDAAIVRRDRQGKLHVTTPAHHAVTWGAISWLFWGPSSASCADRSPMTLSSSSRGPCTATTRPRLPGHAHGLHRRRIEAGCAAAGDVQSDSTKRRDSSRRGSDGHPAGVPENENPGRRT
jgi:hypothetical protein